MTQKSLNTLVQDIYELFNPNKTHTVNEENLSAFLENVGELVRTRLAERPKDSPALRFSSLGKQDRQLWYASRETPSEDLDPKTYFKFLIGDVLESVLLFLAKESGHAVTDEQKEVETDGVFGHIDAIIDGTVVDVKTASPFSFKKFKDGSLIDNDPFGYVNQLSGYAHMLTPGEPAAFLAYDKVSGELCLTSVSWSVMRDFDPRPRITHLKKVLEQDSLPERCYEDVEDGKSGNRKLGVECSYCSFKRECYPNLRTFLYSTGPRFLTKVEREPDVFELP